MKANTLCRTLAVAALLAGPLACSFAGAVPTATPTPSADQAPGPTATAGDEAVALTSTEAPAETTSGECSNPYYPVVEGASWQYSGSNAQSGPFSFTRAFAEIHSDGFTDQDTWDNGLTRTGEWSCEDGNLKALSAGAGAGTVSTSNLSFVADSTTSEGVTLPAQIGAGDSWSQTIRTEGSMTMEGGLTADAVNEASMRCTAQGTASVTVPAGTFDAMRVECAIDMTITMTMSGMEVPPVAITSTQESWYASGVGWVKSTDTSELGTTTIELQSYAIP
jgi:hypothetical protein